MAQQTTKVREGDWSSVIKAIRQLKSNASPGASPSYNNVFISNDITISNGGQIIGLTIERVADEAARNALEFYLARVCYQDDEGVMYLATDY